MQGAYGQRGGGVHPPPGGYARHISDFDMVSKLEQEFEAGMMNGWAATLRRVIAEDCTFVDSRGAVQSKQQILHETGLQDKAAKSWKFDYVHVQIYKKAAIANGYLSLPAAATPQPPALRFRFIRVYLKRKGHWQLVASQETLVEE